MLIIHTSLGTSSVLSATKEIFEGAKSYQKEESRRNAVYYSSSDDSEFQGNTFAADNFTDYETF